MKVKTPERIWIDSKGMYPYLYPKEPSDSAFATAEYIRADLCHRPEPEVREQALEEAAKALGDLIDYWRSLPTFNRSYAMRSAIKVASDLRALKSQPKPQTGDEDED